MEYNRMTRQQLQNRARKLQENLGCKYYVAFDDCESCMTRIYYKTRKSNIILVKEFPNIDLAGQIVVNDYMVSQEIAMKEACGII